MRQSPRMFGSKARGRATAVHRFALARAGGALAGGWNFPKADTLHVTIAERGAPWRKLCVKLG